MTIHFFDVSNNNYPPYFPPSGPTMAKATEGSGFTDSYFTRNRDLTLAGGWPFLPYHFLRHGVSIADQVNHVIDVVGPGQPLMLDIETAEDGSSPTYQEAWQFVKLYGHVTLGYLPHWFWAGHWGAPDLTTLFARMGLISSLYTDYSDNGPGWAAYGGVSPIIWQHTSTPIDTNAFKGTMQQLANVFSGGAVTPEQLAQFNNNTAILYAMVHGADTYWYTDPKNPTAPAVVADMSQYWKRIATEVNKPVTP